MLEFNDIENVLSFCTIDELRKDYQKRQKDNNFKNFKNIKAAVEELEDIIPLFDCNVSSKLKLSMIIILARSIGGRPYELVLETLRKYGYTTDADLLNSIQFADSYFEQELDNKTFLTFLKSAVTIDSGLCRKENITLFRSTVDIPLQPATKILRINNIPKEIRRHNCHEFTKLGLATFPNLYGAYYYINLPFKGAIEHSVLVDYKNGYIIDLANNIAIPIENWRLYYTPEFIISGKHFLDLNQEFEKTYQEKLNMAVIEQVRRKLK